MEESRKTFTNTPIISQSNSINAILNCPICQKKVKKNRMCPKCSQLFCESCIGSLFTKDTGRCPNCQQKLRIKDFLECRFINEIFEAIEKSPVQYGSPIEKCHIHNAELKYYCVDCNLGICSDCAILTSLHKGHQFDHLANIYQYHQETIKQESVLLNERIEELSQALVKIDINIEKSKRLKDEEREDSVAMLEKIQARLDMQLEEYLQVLYQIKDKIYDEINYVEGIKEGIEKDISQSSKSDFILKSPIIIDQLRKFNEQEFEDYNASSINAEFFSELVPEYTPGIFVLNNYKESVESTEIVYSDNICSNGVIWRLKVYPNGNGTAKGNYISVFLELVKGLSAISKYQYKIEMKNHRDSSLNIEKEFTSDFEEGECWGYNRFFRIDLLEEEEYLEASGSLIINFYIRPRTFQQVVKDQHQYIKQIAKQTKKYKKFASSLITKLQQYEDIEPQDLEALGFEERKFNKSNEARKSFSGLEFDCLAESKEGINFESQIPPHHLGLQQIIKLPDFKLT